MLTSTVLVGRMDELYRKMGSGTERSERSDGVAGSARRTKGDRRCGDLVARNAFVRHRGLFFVMISSYSLMSETYSARARQSQLCGLQQCWDRSPVIDHQIGRAHV